MLGLNPFTSFTSKIYGVIAIGLLVGLVIQTIRAEGLEDKLADVRLGRTMDKLVYEAAQKEAQAKAVQQKLLEEERYKDLADDAEKAQAQALNGIRAATDSFIAANRVQGQSTPGSCSGSLGSTTGDDSSVSQSLSPQAVMVTPQDVQICGDLYSYAVEAHNWATSLKSLKPAP